MNLESVVVVWSSEFDERITFSMRNVNTVLGFLTLACHHGS